MLRFAVILLLLMVLPVRANLGESVAQCVKRYGKPMAFSEAGAKGPFGTLVFVAGPYQLLIFLSSDTEVGARVSKKDKTDFNPAEMKTIMDADAATPWVSAPSTDPGTLRWTRDDKATVLYDKDKKMLIFTAPQMAQALKATPAPASAPSPAPPPPPKVPGNFVAPPPFPEAPPPPATNAAPAASP